MFISTLPNLCLDKTSIVYPCWYLPCVVEGIKDKLRKEESLGIFATLPCYQQRSIPSFPFAPNVKRKVESAQVPAPISSIFFLCNKHQVWDPWRVEGGNVTIFTLHCTFPHSCFHLPPVAGRSLYTVISSYLSITTYCLLRRSNAQSAYSCTVCLLMHSLLVQYIRTLWTLTFSS